MIDAEANQSQAVHPAAFDPVADHYMIDAEANPSQAVDPAADNSMIDDWFEAEALPHQAVNLDNEEVNA